MRDFGATFLFSARNGGIPNQTIYTLRQEVSRMFQTYGFGDVLETSPTTFANVNATPAIDVYDQVEEELHISYYWMFPLRVGDIMRLTIEGIPNLHIFANGLGCNLIFRTVIV